MVGAFSSGADAIAEQLRPSDRKSGRWSFPSAVIYGMLWPQAAALEMGWGGSKLLPLLGANNAFWKAIPAVPVPDASPGNPCLQPEDAGPASGRHFHVEARAAPVVAGLSLCSGCSWPPPPACPVPCHGSCVSLGSLLPCVAQGCVGRGGASVREEKGFPSAEILLLEEGRSLGEHFVSREQEGAGGGCGQLSLPWPLENIRRELPPRSVPVAVMALGRGRGGAGG